MRWFLRAQKIWAGCRNTLSSAFRYRRATIAYLDGSILPLLLWARKDPIWTAFDTSPHVRRIGRRRRNESCRRVRMRRGVATQRLIRQWWMRIVASPLPPSLSHSIRPTTRRCTRAPNTITSSPRSRPTALLRLPQQRSQVRTARRPRRTIHRPSVGLPLCLLSITH